MKQGRTLPELACELQRQAQAKRDYLIPADRMRIVSNGRTDLLVQEPFAVSEVAHAQLAAYLGIPKGLYDRLRKEIHTLRVRPPFVAPRFEAIGGPEMAAIRQLTCCDDAPLLDVLVNRLLESKGEDKRLVRTLDGAVRAFLRSSYNPDFNHFAVFQAAAKAIEEAGLGPEHIVSAEVTERRLYLKVVSPNLHAAIRPFNKTGQPGEPAMLTESQVVQAGFLLSHSEIGLGALCIQPIAYMPSGVNLWITPEAYRLSHVSSDLQADANGVVCQDSLRLADAKARLLTLRDSIASALQERKFKTLIKQMQATTEVKLEGRVEKIIDVTARKFGLNRSEKEQILRRLLEGADLSLWGLSNAIILTAQAAVSYDRATELEAIGGRFFSLPAHEVKEIVRAG